MSIRERMMSDSMQLPQVLRVTTTLECRQTKKQTKTINKKGTVPNNKWCLFTLKNSYAWGDAKRTSHNSGVDSELHQKCNQDPRVM